MEFLYLDESGDLGGRGSKFLILTLVITRKKKDLVKIIVDMKKRLLDSKKGRKWLNRKGGEIKFYGFPDRKLLQNSIERLSQLEMKVLYVAIEKNGNVIEPSKKLDIIRLFLEQTLSRSHSQFPIKIISDMNYFRKKRKCYKFQVVKGEHRSQDGEILKLTIRAMELDKLDDDPSENSIIKIEQRNSRLNEELQATDIISGCIFQYYEHERSNLYNILKKGNIMLMGQKKVTMPLLPVDPHHNSSESFRKGSYM